MNGLLQDSPLIEIIREIKAYEMGGALRLSHERVKCAFYFDEGEVVYSASNLRTLRLRETLLRWKLVPESKLPESMASLNEADFILALDETGLTDQNLVKNGLVRQAEDILRHALLWDEGEWHFDPRLRISGEPRFRLDVSAIILEAARRVDPVRVSSRVQNLNDLIEPNVSSWADEKLSPTEAFLLTRIDQPLRVHEVLALSGLSETDTLHHLYSLAVGGHLKRSGWTRIFDDQLVELSRKKAASATRTSTGTRSAPVVQPVETTAEEIDPRKDLEDLFLRLSEAKNYYSVLGLGQEASAADVKRAYHSMARRYHPDRFHHLGDAALRARIDSAFARIAQAYETLSNQNVKAGYDLQMSRASNPVKHASTAEPPPAAAKVNDGDRAKSSRPSAKSPKDPDAMFQAGMTALNEGKTQFAISCFAEAVEQVPSNATFHAYYGKALAGAPQLRHKAEAELKAAISLEPRTALFQVMLADFYRSLGLLRRAQASLESALALEPGNEQIRQSLENVKAKIPR